MRVEQYVMAYGVEQDRLRAILPDGFASLRPVLRFNAEIRDNERSYIEFNTAVEKDSVKGWLNIGRWNDVPFAKNGKTVVFETDFLFLEFISTGIEGSCPAEKDNNGCFYDNDNFVPAEVIMDNKEFCDCRFQWKFAEDNAGGLSIGKTLPAIPTEPKKDYQRMPFTPENAAAIPCNQVLGTYLVKFER